ncbi:hypothetical protein Q5752_000828 [Cryptotrichosporon argae]
MGDNNELQDLWRAHPQPEIMKDLLAAARARARAILTTDLPAKITHLRALLEGEGDPTSDLYPGIVEKGAYVHAALEPAPKDAAASPGVEAGDADKTQVVVDNNDGDHGDGRRWTDRLRIHETQARLSLVLILECEELHIMVTDLRLWLELEIPVLEDGNSFGAEVQADLIKKLEEAQQLTRRMCLNMRQHHLDRVKVATEWLKAPGLDDLEHAMTLGDRFDHLLVRTHLRHTLMLAGAVMNRMEKNWAKVINPKGSGGGGSGMY